MNVWIVYEENEEEEEVVKGVYKDEVMAKYIAGTNSFERIKLNEEELYNMPKEIPASIIKLIHRDLAYENRIIPVEIKEEEEVKYLVVAMDIDKIGNLYMLDNLKYVVGYSAKPMFITSEDFDEAYEKYYCEEKRCDCSCGVEALKEELASMALENIRLIKKIKGMEEKIQDLKEEVCESNLDNILFNDIGDLEDF